MSESHSIAATHAVQWDELGRELTSAVASYKARMEADVAQMQAVVQDAIVTLVDAYQALESRSPLVAGEEVGSSAARTALQFEDVLSQLLHRMVERCGYFEPLPALVAERLVGIAKDAGPRDDDASLQAEIRDALNTLRMQVDRIQKRDIGQRSMDAGTVELF